MWGPGAGSQRKAIYTALVPEGPDPARGRPRQRAPPSPLHSNRPHTCPRTWAMWTSAVRTSSGRYPRLPGCVTRAGPIGASRSPLLPPPLAFSTLHGAQGLLSYAGACASRTPASADLNPRQPVLLGNGASFRGGAIWAGDPGFRGRDHCPASGSLLLTLGFGEDAACGTPRAGRGRGGASAGRGGAFRGARRDAGEGPPDGSAPPAGAVPAARSAFPLEPQSGFRL